MGHPIQRTQSISDRANYYHSLGISFLILIHELGHYLLARLVGMRASKFSIGFGPAIVKLESEETVFQIGLFPIGGYVQLSGLTNLESDEDEPVGELFDGRDYGDRPIWQRFLVIAAGPLFNFGFAIVAYAFLFGSFNAVTYDWQRTPTLVVKNVDGPAEAAGLRPSDVILRLNDQPLRGFGHLRKLIGESDGKTIRLTIARSPDGSPPPVKESTTEVDGLLAAQPVVPASWARQTVAIQGEKTPRGIRLGIEPHVMRFGTEDWFAALKLGVMETWLVTTRICEMLVEKVKGSDEVEFASIVKITSVGADTVRMGAEWFLNLLALLSVNLGLLNLLPIPALDGGRLVFIGIEAISRQAVPKKIEAIVHGVGMLLILGFIVVVMLKEVVELFQGG